MGVNPQSDADQLEAAADHAIEACGGDTREAVKALIVANQQVWRFGPPEPGACERP